ncbi:hypothetical protein FRC12_024689 [Ceratobasidium sp. 428]|nr:hypothetical protein FRC12_024689 [Ceratobasidium sp. 428]
MGNAMNTARSALRPAVDQFCRVRDTAADTLRVFGNMSASYWRRFRNWISQPHIRRRILIIAGVGLVIFLLVVIGVTTFGFGPAGVVAGSAAAATQSAVFGAFVPAGSWFAVMTSIGMTSGILPLIAAGAALLGMGGVATYLFGFQDHHA